MKTPYEILKYAFENFFSDKHIERLRSHIRKLTLVSIGTSEATSQYLGRTGIGCPVVLACCDSQDEIWNIFVEYYNLKLTPYPAEWYQLQHMIEEALGYKYYHAIRYGTYEDFKKAVTECGR